MHRSARVVYPMGAFALALPLPVLLGYALPAPLPYAWHKALHILGVVLFLGNVATGALWGALAVATRNPASIRFALGTICWSDAVFTGPGVLLTMYNGLAMAQQWGGIAAHRFTAWGLALLMLILVAWLAFVVPDQHRILAAADRGEAPGPTSRVVLRWNLVGSIAGALAFVVMAMMVTKP